MEETGELLKVAQIEVNDLKVVVNEIKEDVSEMEACVEVLMEFVRVCDAMGVDPSSCI